MLYRLVEVAEDDGARAARALGRWAVDALLEEFGELRAERLQTEFKYLDFRLLPLHVGGDAVRRGILPDLGQWRVVERLHTPERRRPARVRARLAPKGAATICGASAG